MSEMTVAVITPTTGDKRCLDAIRSVWRQDYQVNHIIVVDGPSYIEDFWDNVREEVDSSFVQIDNYKRTVIELPWNTGRVGQDKYWGHRIFAGLSHLVNEDIVLFLDDDNTFAENHVSSQVNNIVNNKLEFSYSLRNICDSDGKFLFQDNCESLGKWPVWNGNHFHMDTSAYAFRRDFLIGVAHLWHGGYAQDRKFFNAVRNLSGVPHDTTGKYTLNYNLGSTETSASVEFFKQGNQVSFQKHPFGFPWVKK